jgi:hypothetical protein
VKCIQCGTDNKLTDRTNNGGRCKNCNHAFTFEPTAMGAVKFTDPFFAKAISDVSANGSLFFTTRQLGYIIDRKAQRKIFKSGMIEVIASFLSTVVLASIVISTSNFFITLFCVLAATPMVKRLRDWMVNNFFAKNRQPLVKDFEVEDWLQVWASKNGAVSQQLPPVTNGALNPDNDVSIGEVSNYSFDRLVVCDRPAIAQMLIANNFHFEHNCAVLSVSGYPQQIFSTTMEMLRRNPDLQVFAFHDCSPKGLRLVHELGNSRDWFAGSNVRIVDIGLLPRQVLAKSKGLSICNSSKAAQDARSLGPQIRQGLSAKELKWLDKGNYVELESFTPQKLIMVLQRGIAGAQQMDSVDGGDMVFIDSNSDGGFYAIDSFG